MPKAGAKALTEAKAELAPVQVKRERDEMSKASPVVDAVEYVDDADDEVNESVVEEYMDHADNAGEEADASAVKVTTHRKNISNKSNTIVDMSSQYMNLN